MADSPLTISYKPEAKDYIRASRALAVKSTSFIIMAVLLMIAMLAALVILLVPSIGDPGWQNIALVFLLVGLFYVLYFVAIIPWQLSRAYKKNEHLQVERAFTLKDDSIGVRVGVDNTELEWENLQKVIDAKYLYMMIYKDSRKLYFFIPDRAFNEDVTGEAFVAYLKAKAIPVN